MTQPTNAAISRWIRQPTSCLSSGSQRTSVMHPTMKPITTHAQRSSSSRPATSFDGFLGIVIPAQRLQHGHGSNPCIPLGARCPGGRAHEPVRDEFPRDHAPTWSLFFKPTVPWSAPDEVLRASRQYGSVPKNFFQSSRRHGGTLRVGLWGFARILF